MPQASVPIVTPPRPRAIRRADDRRLTFAGVLVAAAFLAVAAIVAALTVAGRMSGPWAALHLVLAGAAGCAIAAVLPFFTSALAQVAPSSARIRIGAVAFIAVGTLVVTTGVSAGASGAAALGGIAYLLGLALVAVAVFVPLRSALGRRSTLVLLAYGVALAEVAIGVGLATAMMAGWAPVTSQWANLKPAHAWLNVFGFLSVVIAATLIHLAPTVNGTRIRPRRSSTLALVALLTGAPAVAIGFAAGWDAVGRIGAALEVLGSVALVVHGIEVRRGPGGWTTDLGWHRFAIDSLSAAPVWFLVATSIAAGRIVWLGAVPAAWSVAVIGIPLALGWTVQVLFGAWTHLVPAIGPGSPAVHASQRRMLARWGRLRFASLNGAVALLTVGAVAGLDAVTALGAIGLVATSAVTLGLLVGAVVSVTRRTQTVAAVPA